MKKLFGFLTLFIVLSISTVYLFLFTSFGNGFISEVIEKNAKENGLSSFEVLDFTLTTKNIRFKANIDSKSYFDISGGLNLFARSMDLTYIIDIKDLSKFQKLINQKLNGNFRTSGTIKGNETYTKVEGISDVFESDTKYIIGLKEFKPGKINVTIKNAKIEKLLNTVNQPNYANGFIDINANILNVNVPLLEGVITTKIHKGNVNNPIVNKAFNLNLKDLLSFNGDINTTLKLSTVVSKVNFITSIANISTKKAQINLKDNSIKSDYQLKIPNLSKLYDITNTKMRGNLLIDGNISKTKNLVITGVSNIFNGKLDFRLKNDDFTAHINEVEIKPLTHMLYYPEIFDSKANASMTYDLVNASGKIDATLNDGHFLPNKFSAIINQFARFDLTKEVYESVKVDSSINKEIINSTVQMSSKYTQIAVLESELNSKKRTIDANVLATIKGLSADAVVSGTLDNPKVKVDTSKLLKDGAKKKAIQKVEDKIKKELGNSKEADSVIKGLKSLFN